MSKATLAVISALIFIFAGVLVAVALARGYRPDFDKRTLLPTGILVATSDPDGASVLIDGKLKTATNNTINLAPAKYKVRIQKDGFTPWEKDIEIKKEEVFKTNAFLFPSLADLRPLTFTGAINPTVSPDQTKIAYGIASASARISGLDGNGVWIIDMGRNLLPPVGGAGDFRQIFRNTPALALSGANFTWSPDGKQILADGYLLDTDRLNDSPVPVATDAVLETWKAQTAIRHNARLAKLPAPLRSLVNIQFSPDETKILYTATVSAQLPKFLTSYLPGTDPTPETRSLTPNSQYVYDLKEDKNFLINGPVAWFPSSRHLISVGGNQISLTEYDGTNKAVVFNGAFIPEAVFVWPNWSKIIILTNLGSSDPLAQNLYTINLR